MQFLESQNRLPNRVFNKTLPASPSPKSWRVQRNARPPLGRGPCARPGVSLDAGPSSVDARGFRGDAGLVVCRPGLRPSLPSPLLTAKPQRRPGVQMSAGGWARGPRLLREALQSGGLLNGGEAQARERARDRRTVGRSRTGSAIGTVRSSTRANQIAGGWPLLGRECVGAWSSPPCPRK